MPSLYKIKDFLITVLCLFVLIISSVIFIIIPFLIAIIPVGIILAIFGIQVPLPDDLETCSRRELILNSIKLYLDYCFVYVFPPYYISTLVCAVLKITKEK